MKREELILKIQVLSDIYSQLEQQGVFGIMSDYLHPTRINRLQCRQDTFIKIAGDKSIEIKERKDETWPYMATVYFNDFSVYTIGNKEDMEYIKNALQEVESVEDNKQSEPAKTAG